MPYCAKCGRSSRGKGRYCIHCGTAFDQNAQSADDLTLITTLLQAGNNAAPESLARIPPDRFERLSFTLFQAALAMAAEAVTRRVEAKAAVTAAKTKRSQSVARNDRDQNADRVVAIAEAAQLLGYSTKWIYTNAKALPFTRVTPTGRLRFSVKGIMEYLDSLKIVNDRR
jgi:predicted DNA-binding transcriptional regulator AlpA